MLICCLFVWTHLSNIKHTLAGPALTLGSTHIAEQFLSDSPLVCKARRGATFKYSFGKRCMRSTKMYMSMGNRWKNQQDFVCFRGAGLQPSKMAA